MFGGLLRFNNYSSTTSDLLERTAILVNSTNPTRPETNDPIMIENFASDIIRCSPEKDRIAIKIDMVKPIPPKIPTPKICFHCALEGILQTPSFTEIQENNVIPIGLPTNNPRIIPKPSGVVSPSTIPLSNKILVLTNAKTGMIKKLTGLSNICSSFSRGDSFSSGVVGNVKAVSTPAMV